MKTITKLGMAAFFMLAMVFTSNAQLRLGAGLMTGLPTGSSDLYSFSDANGFGIGGGISGEYMVTDNIGVCLQVGFLSFSGETETITETVPGFGTSETEIENPAITMIPLQLTGRYHFMPDEDFNFYAGLGLGLNLVTPEEGDGESGLAINPHIGANYMFTDELGLDLSIGYNIVNVSVDVAGEDETIDYSYLPINLGVVYIID